MISTQSIALIHDHFLSHVTPQKKPTLFATCGIPGAGKSYFVDSKIKAGEFPSNAYILNPDRVMIALPEYQDDVKTMGAQKSYEKWELPARELAYTMAETAMDMKANIIKDMGCANPLSLKLIKQLKNKLYCIKMYYIHCEVSVAFDRINQRDFQIAKNEVRQRFKLLEDLLPHYQSLADHFEVLDNTSFTNKNIATPLKENTA
jgi:predicted ABC-type ATPase